MDIFEIQGPVRLNGTIKVSGSKNAALPILAGAILGAGESVIQGVPNLADISVLKDLLISLGAKAERRGADYYLDTTTIDNPVGHYDIVRKMRASICILGPLLARCGVVKAARSAIGRWTFTCGASRNWGRRSRWKTDTSWRGRRAGDCGANGFFWAGRSDRQY